MPAPGAGAVAVGGGAAEASSGSECTECSHCNNPRRRLLRARSGVRVSINLGHFFSDQRARAFMWAPYGRCVQWLGRRVARVFGLPDDIALMCRGHMLPVIEPLLMLDRDDPVEVVNMSYVFTAQEKQDEPRVTQQRNTNTIDSSAIRESSNVNSNVNTKQENAGQLPSSSQGEGPAEDTGEGPVEGPGQSPSEGSIEGPVEDPMDHCAADDGEQLQRLKRHALQLLDAHCHMLGEAGAPKRLRRRRRRKPHSPPPCEPAPAPAPAPPAPQRPAPPAGAVLRNGSGSRPPRLVRALSPIAE